jgi:hypothetical protein
LGNKVLIVDEKCVVGCKKNENVCALAGWLAGGILGANGIVKAASSPKSALNINAAGEFGEMYQNITLRLYMARVEFNDKHV